MYIESAISLLDYYDEESKWIYLAKDADKFMNINNVKDDDFFVALKTLQNLGNFHHLIDMKEDKKREDVVAMIQKSLDNAIAVLKDKSSSAKMTHLQKDGDLQKYFTCHLYASSTYVYLSDYNGIMSPSFNQSMFHTKLSQKYPVALLIRGYVYLIGDASERGSEIKVHICKSFNRFFMDEISKKELKDEIAKFVTNKSVFRKKDKKTSLVNHYLSQIVYNLDDEKTHEYDTLDVNMENLRCEHEKFTELSYASLEYDCLNEIEMPFDRAMYVDRNALVGLKKWVIQGGFRQLFRDHEFALD